LEAVVSNERGELALEVRTRAELLGLGIDAVGP
jgi:hypothetical protein